MSSKGATSPSSSQSRKRSLPETGWVDSQVYSQLYSEKRRVGKGSYGEVYECIHRIDEVTYAIKKTSFSMLKFDECVSEVKILAKMQHENIIRYFQSWIVKGAEELSGSEDDLFAASDEENELPKTETLFIALEYCPWTLEKRMDQHIDRETKMKFALQILSAIAYLHENGVIHRDLARSNILVDDQDNIKIADFGLALEFSKDSKVKVSTYQGIADYRAPEIALMEEFAEIDEKIDVFSAGLLIFEMFHPPFGTKYEKIKIFDALRKGIFDWGKMKDQEFLKMFLIVNPSERVSAKEIIDFTKLEYAKERKKMLKLVLQKRRKKMLKLGLQKRRKKMLLKRAHFLRTQVMVKKFKVCYVQNRPTPSTRAFNFCLDFISQLVL